MGTCGRPTCCSIAVAICFFLIRDRSSRNNTPLSLCFFYLLLCVIQHCQCSSRARQGAPTAAGSILCTCSRSALYSKYDSKQWCLLLLSSAFGLCTYLLHVVVCDRHFFLRADHPQIAGNHSYKHRVPQHSMYTNILKLRTAVCPTLLAGPRASRKSTSTLSFVAVRVSYAVVSYHMAF